MTGIPTDDPVDFSNMGFPFSYGCRAHLSLSNAGQRVVCTISSPTVGPNSFSCDGNADATIKRDVNGEMVGRVRTHCRREAVLRHRRRRSTKRSKKGSGG